MEGGREGLVTPVLVLVPDRGIHLEKGSVLARCGDDQYVRIFVTTSVRCFCIC